MELQFTVLGRPRGKGRPRFGNGRTYTDKQTLEYERLIATRASEAMPCPAVETSVIVRIVVYKGIPVSWSKGRRQRAMMGGEIPGKPDLDNVAKAVLDALNGVAYVDDVQVVKLMVSKHYSDEPRIEVSVRESLE
jgi:Holliday junction resolvase RusA-like endonuclease